MTSWIYLFSKFTQEALLFEALFIAFLCASYAAFWVLRKRKYGVLGPDTPAYAVKSYLNQLIGDAEVMRVQLFGLLAGTGIDPAAMAALRASSGAGAVTGASTGATATAPSGPLPTISAAALAADPELATKLQAFESKMAEQAKAIETITVEKVRTESELIQLKANKGAGDPAAPAADPKLAEKIKALEAKLAEYSVIEDDLANLKRLQQENTQLKAQLSGQPAGAAAPVAAAPAVAEPIAPSQPTAAVSEAPLAAAETAAPVSVEEVGAAAAAVAATEAAIAEAAAAPAAVEASAAEPIAAPTADPAFEGLVDQVEQSLAPPAAEPPAGASVADPSAPAAESPLAAASAAATAPTEKSDADLVAEFEKMLNS